MTILVAKSTRRKRNNGQKKAVRCIDTGAVYASCSDAADILSLEGNLINPRNILFVCQGIQKKAGGLRWEYADATQRSIAANNDISNVDQNT